jgi:hypothetical protein
MVRVMTLTFLEAGILGGILAVIGIGLSIYLTRPR